MTAPSDSGNDAQIRAVGEQLFSVWEAEQARKQKEKHRWLGSNFPGWVSVVVVVVGAIMAGSTTFNLAYEADARSLKNETSISTIKADTSDRLARIETKIDLMIDERNGKGGGR